MKLIVVRHGQTNYNVERKINFLPSKKCYLTTQGVQDAKTAKEILKDKDWDVVIISEMYRTEQTAAIINEDRQKFVFIDPLINEHNIGVEGESYDVYRFFSLDNPQANHYKDIPGSESFADVTRRVEKFLKELKTKKFDSVLIVTHMCVLRAIKQVVENLESKDLKEYVPKNAEIYECEI